MGVQEIVTTITEHGWPAHFIAARHCIYKRNTHIRQGDKFLVVSSVGSYKGADGAPEPIGHNRYYETMMFPGHIRGGYEEAITCREIGTPEFLECGLYGETPADLPECPDRVMDGHHDAIVAYVAKHFEEYYPADTQEETDAE
jgi:hypothetical protein